MDTAEDLPIVDTTREELRSRIASAAARFDRAARAADPRLVPRGQAWTVQQIVAHVLSLGHRYRQIVRGSDYHHASTPSGIAAVNQAELEATIAPVPVMVDELRAVCAEVDSFFDTMTDDRPTIPFHGFGVMSGTTMQTNWLGELLLHGQDIARAERIAWELPERDMLLVLRGAREMVPLYFRPDVSPELDLCVAFEIDGARPYLIRVHDSVAEMRARHPDDHIDATLRAPAATLVQLLYQRIGQISAVRHGLRLVGGRRPWKAFKLVSCFERP